MASAKNKKQVSAKKVLILHIGSDSVVGALGIFSDNDRPHIVETAEEEIKLTTHESELEFMKLFRNAAVRVTETLSRAGHFIPEHVHVSLESPWFTGQTRTIYYSKKEPFVFSEKLSNSLIDQDFLQYKKEAESVYGESLQALDKSVITTKVNGFQIAQPYGKKGREVTILYYASLTPKLFVDSLCESLEKVIRGRIQFFSASVALSAALYMTLERKKKLLVVSIGGEVTELLYLEDGILVNTSTFPSGRHLLLRTLGDELKQNPLEVFSLLNMCRDGRAHETITAKINQIVESVEKAWTKDLRNAVHEVVGPGSAEVPVMIIGAADTLPWFKKMVANEHMTSRKLEAAISAKTWSGIISADFVKQQSPSQTLAPLILADCLYIYGINV